MACKKKGPTRKTLKGTKKVGDTKLMYVFR